MSRFARAAVAAAGAGFALGVQLGSSSSSVSAQPATRSSIAGVYRLVPAAADDVAAGLLVYEPNGRMSCQLELIKRGSGEKVFAGFSGKYYMHGVVDASLYPHGGPCVEHEVTAASSASMVGQSSVQRYRLSADGSELTTSHVALTNGVPRQVGLARWQRVEL
mmetsp:Transcript_18000/g.53344  ORF Transcript_18000/g.53344 Transcript_18000/m.53344 type:complete len:163 (+) Transcript_18000:30-518(+)